MTRVGTSAWRWIISGRVQGVAFRWHTCRAARDLGLVGWVRNRPDGTVEVQVAGPPEAVASLREIVHRGPSVSSRVDRLDRTPLDEMPREPAGAGWQTFEIYPDGST